jgi:hypothetical protein
MSTGADLTDVMTGLCPLNNDNHCNNCEWRLYGNAVIKADSGCVIFGIFTELRNLNRKGI